MERLKNGQCVECKETRHEAFELAVKDLMKTPPAPARFLDLADKVTREAMESIKNKLEARQI